MNAHSASISGTGSTVLDDLAEVIGEAAALALAWEFRGERVYFPKDPAREPRLAAAIGPPAAERLCRIFGGTHAPIPFKAVLDRKVAELAAQTDPKLTRREIARACCIAEPRVYAILKAQRESGRESGRASDQLRLL